MEAIGTVLSRTLPTLGVSHAPPAPALRDVEPRPRTLHDLVARFEDREARENSDVVVLTSALRTPDGAMLAVPGLGSFGFNEWSRRQCASLLGARFDRWFENASQVERADEMNRRFRRASGTVRIRTTKDGAEDGADGIVRAFVSSSYAPITDSRLARMLVTALTPTDPELRIVRSDITDRSVSYVVKVGEPYKKGGPGDVGDIWGGLLVRNSGVGFASLLIALNLTRLVCKNGMVAPLPDAVLVRRRHRSLGDHGLQKLLVSKLEQLPERLHMGADLLRSSRDRHIANVEAELTTLLEQADLPRRHVPALLAAYSAEPEATAFGVAQAATLAAQSMSPEARLELELAAGAYIAAA